MNIKLIGAFCVIAGCGGWGFMMASQHVSKIRQLRNLIAVLEYMQCELEYRCTPLPQLCRQAGTQCQGKIRYILLALSDELDAQISPDASRCMAAVLDRCGELPDLMRRILAELGNNLGKFDISGQLRGLEHARCVCRENLEYLTKNNENRIRSYQTLGLCAGAAIAILFV